jgi:hypothetical protein
MDPTEEGMGLSSLSSAPPLSGEWATAPVDVVIKGSSGKPRDSDCREGVGQRGTIDDVVALTS